MSSRKRKKADSAERACSVNDATTMMMTSMLIDILEMATIRMRTIRTRMTTCR